MSAPAPLRNPAALTHGLLGHASGEDTFAWCGARRVSAGEFLREARALAAALPEAGHVLNFCADRYRFAVTLAAAMLRGQVTLLPSTTTANVIGSMRAFAPDVYYISDDEGAQVDLPRFVPRATLEAGAAEYSVPAIDAAQVVACVFTSGSTGEPQPHFKTWGSLATCIGAEARRLAVGSRHTVLGTVPPQHMYGFESTVLLPMLAGAALSAERLYFPADIDAAVARAPAPRLIFTTPFHLRAWLEGTDCAALETIVSATAPLSVDLARRAEARTGAQLHEIYGCTEAGQVATRRPTQDSAWEPFDGLRVWIEGEQAMVGGGHVARPTPLADLIEVHADGARFELRGRTADMVNIAGKRNSIGYLNHQLASIAGVVDAAFFLPDEEAPDAVTRLMAFVVAPGLQSADILRELRGRIDAAFLPRPLVMVESLPRGLAGKLPREALRALARAARSRGASED